MHELVEAQNIPLEEAKFGGTKDFTQVAFGNAFRITDRMKRFNKIGLMEKLTKSLKKAMAEGKDIEIAKMFNNMTATTYASGFDSLALAHDSHTCLDDSATTYDNYLDQDLATGSYETALQNFDAIYDDQGNIFVGKAKKLVVNKSLRVKAYQLTGADKKPFEQSNTKYDLNSYYGFDVVPFVYHRFSGSTAWMLIGDVRVALIRFASGPQIVLGDNSGALMALNSEGQPLWNSQLGSNEVRGMDDAKINGQTYAAIATNDGNLAVYESDGNQVWSTTYRNSCAECAPSI